MTDKNTYIKELETELKKMLPEYLALHGREVKRNGEFRCVTPELHAHGDRNYSANLTMGADGVYVWNCFACGSAGTIIDAAHYLEGYLTSGPGYKHTLINLAEQVGIPVDYSRIELSDKESEAVYTAADINTEIEEFMRTQGSTDCLTNGSFGRSYTPGDIEQIKEITTISSVDLVALNTYIVDRFGTEQVKRLPFWYETADYQGLDQMVFGNDIMTIVIKTHYGKIVGFAGRASTAAIAAAEAQGQKRPKYKFTNGMSAMKSEALFLLNQARREIRRTGTVRLVEGPFDAISMWLKGYRNTVAIMGSAINQQVVDSLLTYGTEHVNFILDADVAGIKGVRKALRLLRSYVVVTTATVLPDGMDPDAIATGGDASILEQEVDAVEYVLNTDPEFNDATKNPDVMYNHMIDFVVSSVISSAKLSRYAAVIAEKSSFQQSDILLDLQEHQVRRETMGHEAQVTWNRVLSAEKMPLLDRAAILSEASSTFRSLSAGESGVITRDTWELYMSLVNREKPLPKIIQTCYPVLDKLTTFQCGTLAIVSGWSSNGKSSWLRCLTFQMIVSNPNVYVIYVSIDDPVEAPMISFLSLMTKIMRNDVDELIRNGAFNADPRVRSQYETMQDVLTQRLCLKGSSDCNSIALIRRVIDQVKVSMPGRDIVVVVDAVNNLSDMEGNDPRVAIERIIRQLKFMAVETESCIIMVNHLVKADERRINKRPRLGDIKGSSFIEYEAKNILLVHMNMHYNQDDTRFAWHSPNGMYLPIVEINVAKDKQKKANEVIPFRFDPDWALMTECTQAETIELRQRIKDVDRLSTGGSDYDSGSFI